MYYKTVKIVPLKNKQAQERMRVSFNPCSTSATCVTYMRHARVTMNDCNL